MAKSPTTEKLKTKRVVRRAESRLAWVERAANANAQRYKAEVREIAAEVVKLRSTVHTERARHAAERVELYAQIHKGEARVSGLVWALVLAQETCAQRELVLRQAKGDKLALAG